MTIAELYESPETILRRRRVAHDALIAKCVAAQQAQASTVRTLAYRMTIGSHEETARLRAELITLDELITQTEQARLSAKKEQLR
jgi:hypothetical protein